MPTSFTGLFIFVVFILPGLAFVAIRERTPRSPDLVPARHPARDETSAR